MNTKLKIGIAIGTTLIKVIRGSAAIGSGLPPAKPVFITKSVYAAFDGDFMSFTFTIRLSVEVIAADPI